jgi:general secretion pathway protein J
MTEPRDGMAGFTLLELLVTMSILGLLTMVMFGGMRFGVQVWARTGTDLTAANAARKAEEAIQADLSRAYPLYSSSGTTAQIAFDGMAHSIHYLAPSHAEPGALEAVVLEAVGDDKTQQLVRTARIELSRTGDAHSKVLLTHLNNVAFSYFGTSRDGGKPIWSDAWRNKTRLPQLIRVVIEMGDATTQSFVVAPRLAADAGCVFDALTKNCRGR